MKRFHAHVSVDDLTSAIRFYSAVFNEPPSVEKSDYAKWMLDEPRINFAISSRGAESGLDHFGIQVDSTEELDEIHARLQQADIDMLTQTGTACCYAESDKHWIKDPAGIPWEAYHTLGSIPTYNRGEDTADNSACCAPAVIELKPISSQCTPGSGCC